MKRSLFALLFSLPLVTFAGLASADGRGHGDGKDAVAYPVPAADFQARHDARVAKMRAKMEERIVAKKVDATKAKEWRARFDARVAKVQTAINAAKADGKVTKEEAQEIRKTAHEGHQGKGRHHKKA
jgi:uncharacterized membrane protein YebE (DUF533 family)